jgi:RsiW-degrading membrane proteinase PrsW (M82 family)
MPTYQCPACARPFFVKPLDPPLCPTCQGLAPADSIVPPLDVPCACGKVVKVSAVMAGKRVECPQCKQGLDVPGIPVTISPSPNRAKPPEKPQRSVRDYGYALFLLALIPLVASVFQADDNVKARIEQTQKQYPGVIEKVEKSPDATEDDLFRALPEHKLVGAHVPRFTYRHWMYALAAAVLFMGLMLVAFGTSVAQPLTLLKIGVFTGTIGILLLLAVQFIAEVTQHMGLYVGRSIIVIIFYILKFIGFSYRAALDPESGFLLSAFGFTFGVGLCEELCKALPLIWHFRRTATLTWRGACLWGFATGVGFGISEAVSYSSDFYNGISTGGIYIVRFISCVALHAIWSSAAGITIWRRQNDVQGDMSWYDWFVPIFKLLGVVMILHGLYDTLLKKDLEGWAIAVALASFAWLGWQIETMRRMENEPMNLSAAGHA